MPTLADGTTVTKKVHDSIVKAALSHADDQGYCAEVEEFLETLGFTIPNETATVTIEVTVSGFGRNTDDLHHDFNWQVYGPDGDTDSIKVVSVK